MGNLEGSSQNFNSYIHPRLGQIKRLQEDDTDQYLQYQVSVDNVSRVNAWQVELNNLKDTPCSSKIFLPVDFEFKKYGVCGMGGVLNLTFLDYMFSLGEQIKNRKQIRRPFHETEIWFLLFNLVKVEAQLSVRNKRIGDVQPSNILINEEGQIQVISQYSWPGLVDAFTSFTSGESEKVYLSPEEYKPPSMIRKNQHQQPHKERHNQNICEMYSIGMTILQTASLLDCSKLYHNYEINEFLLNEYLQVVQRNYRRQLVVILRMLLKNYGRVTPVKLLEILTPYESQIMNLENFQFMSKIQDLDEENENTMGSNTQRSIEMHIQPQKYMPINRSPPIRVNFGSPLPVARMSSLPPQYVQRYRPVPTPIYRNQPYTHSSVNFPRINTY